MRSGQDLWIEPSWLLERRPPPGPPLRLLPAPGPRRKFKVCQSRGAREVFNGKWMSGAFMGRRRKTSPQPRQSCQAHTQVSAGPSRREPGWPRHGTGGGNLCSRLVPLHPCEGVWFNLINKVVSIDPARRVPPQPHGRSGSGKSGRFRAAGMARGGFGWPERRGAGDKVGAAAARVGQHSGGPEANRGEPGVVLWGWRV